MSNTWCVIAYSSHETLRFNMAELS